MTRSDVARAHATATETLGTAPHARDVIDCLALEQGVEATREEIIEACRELGLALADMPGEPTDVTREMPAVKVR